MLVSEMHDYLLERADEVEQELSRLKRESSFGWPFNFERFGALACVSGFLIAACGTLSAINELDQGEGRNGK